MKSMQAAETATKTWIYVEPYLYKNADSGRYYSRFGRQGFRALKTDRISVARLRMADQLRDHKSRIGLYDAAANGDVNMEQVILLYRQALDEDPALGVSTKKTAASRCCALKRPGPHWPE